MDDINLWIGATALLITVASFGYAIYSAKRSARQKHLAYQVLPPAPLAYAASPQSSFSVTLTYRESGENPVTVEAVFVQYLRFANLGQLPVRRVDSAEADPLRIQASGGNPLSLALVGTSRAVCQISLADIQREGEHLVGRLDFDFLDHMDGGLVQVVSESPGTSVALKGTIIGMPSGVVRAKEPRSKVFFPDLGCVIPLIAVLLSMVCIPFIYRNVTGSWHNVWLLLLPVAAIVLPLILSLPVLYFSVFRSEPRFPSPLEPPRHYFARLAMFRDSIGRDIRERSPRR